MMVYAYLLLIAGSYVSWTVANKADVRGHEVALMLGFLLHVPLVGRIVGWW